MRNFLTRQTDPYYLASGRVNLGEALHGLGEREEGLVHLGEAISFAEENSYTRLWANALHVRAQCYAELGQKKKSNADLAKALKLFGDSPTADAFLIHRQIAFNQAAQSGNAKYLHQFRAKAARAQQWESLREVDYHILRLRFDRHLFSKLYWGTPYEAYRARLRRLGSPPPEYLWGPPGGRCLELSLGECRGESVLGKQPLAMLGQLLSDFYMPQSLGRIFSGVFPGERYHWKHSPNKVHQVLSRLRKVFQQKKIPLAVECRQGFYLLRPTGAFSVRLTEGQKGGGDPLERLARKFAGDFSAGAARAHLALPKTTVHRYLALAMDSGLVTKSGRGRATVYRFGEKKTQGA